MTSMEAYVMGWVFGRLTAAASSDIGGDLFLACQRPYSALARIMAAAHRQGLMTANLDAEIGSALADIDCIEPPMSGGSEACQPLERQGSWQLGYYAGKSGRPCSSVRFDIAAARRAKGMTQGELADAMGVDQPVISRWEAGKVDPTEENIAKLKELLR